jgi:ADP-heptose:LPS heptosyltransferase
MTTEKKLGIWMDHSIAHVIEFAIDQNVNAAQTKEAKIIESKFTREEKEQTLEKSENVMHNKEKHLQSEYYKKLAEVIKNYDEVILFGPTEAKKELLNALKADHHFEKIKIDIQQADKMTPNQQRAFVREYFSKHLLNKEHKSS